jgi:transcriptional regulator with PAS, ATPase and Fis domain
MFLDEVNDMSPSLQVKLLRVLQTGEYSRVGSTDIRYCDVRIIAASSQDLHELVSTGKFREELYYRLNIVDIWLPPLRERKSDIPILARHFIQMYGAKYHKERLQLSKEAEILLLMYDFPGQVRELENMIQHAVIVAEGDTIGPEHLPPLLSWGKIAVKIKRENLTFKAAILIQT